MNRRLTDEDYRQISAALKAKISQSEIACRFGISQGHVSRIKHRKLGVLRIKKSNPKRSLIMPLKRIDYQIEQTLLIKR